MRGISKTWPVLAIVPLVVWLGCTGDDPAPSNPDDDAGQESATGVDASDAGVDAAVDSSAVCDPNKAFEGTGTRFGATINRGSTTYGARLSPERTTIYFTSLGPGNNPSLFFSTGVLDGGDGFGPGTLFPGLSPTTYRYHAALTADGIDLVFNDGAGGQGIGQLFATRRTSLGGDFAAPSALDVGDAGAPADGGATHDTDPWLTPDGSTLYFARLIAPLQWAIFRAPRNGSALSFGPAALVPGLTDVNTSFQAPVTTAGGTVIYFAKSTLGLGNVDIFRAPIDGSGNVGVATPLGTNINFTATSYEAPTWVSDDECILLFYRDGAAYWAARGK
jgi:hypothetical protein